MKTIYAISIDIEVTDRETLYNTALAHAVNDGESEEDVAGRLRPDGEIDVSACITQLYDPGSSYGGTEIQDSSVEVHP